MALSSVSIENFKAFQSKTTLQLKPLTVLIGGNSSGKSSVIHALAALKQTAQKRVKERALVLDGPETLVSLGRYVDAVYGHNYKTHIGLGFGFSTRVPIIAGRGRRRSQSIDLNYWWKFSGTLRTQRVRLESRVTSIDGEDYIIKRRPRGGGLVASRAGTDDVDTVIETQNIGVRVQPLYRRDMTEDQLDALLGWQNLNLSDEEMLKELERLKYLGPFRQPPQRLYPYHGPSADVGPEGTLAVPLLVSEMMASSQRPNKKYVVDWLNNLGLAEDLQISRQGSSDSFRVELSPRAGTSKATPADIGFGFSQVLPVVVQCAYAEEGSTLLFEQPELHLHPTAQHQLGEFFVDSLRRRPGTFVIETHSRKLVGSFQAAIRDGILNPNELAVYGVRWSDGQAQLRAFTLDEEGDMWDSWDRAFPDNWDQ